MSALTPINTQFSDLPIEIVKEIATHLPAESILSLSKTCRTFDTELQEIFGQVFMQQYETHLKLITTVNVTAYNEKGLKDRCSDLPNIISKKIDLLSMQIVQIDNFIILDILNKKAP